MDFFKFFSYYSQKMMISPYYFGPPVLIDPVYYNALLRTEEKERYSRESAITGKTLPGPFLQNRTTYRNVRAPDLDEPIF
jgi:hypothetical protein